jgi:hypothetical protein
MGTRDKIAVICSSLLLLAILAAGAYGLSRAYQYGETPMRTSNRP